MVTGLPVRPVRGQQVLLRAQRAHGYQCGYNSVFMTSHKGKADRYTILSRIRSCVPIVVEIGRLSSSLKKIPVLEAL